MSTRTSFLALAAITSLGVAALAPTTASAFGGHGFARGGHFGHARVGIGIRAIHRPIISHVRPHWHWHWRHHRYYPVPVAVGAAAVGGAVYAASRPTTCTCLTKEYLPDGSVLFKDVCTHEAAMQPANAQAQAPAPAP